MAEDRWENELFECSFGGLRIDVQSTADVNGRVLATHQMPHADAHPVRDQGAEPRVTRCRLVFFAVRADDDYRERFYFFKDLVDRGETATFVHPISGSYRARVGQFDWSAHAEERDCIRVECSFHEDATEPAMFQAESGGLAASQLASVATSAAAVRAALDEYNAGLVDVDDPQSPQSLRSPVPGQALELASTWEDSDETLDVRDVTRGLVQLSNRISEETDRLELLTDLDRYPVLIAFQGLQHNLRRAAQALLDEGPRIVEVTTESPTSIYALASRIYRGDPAQEQRVEDILRLNDIANPARLEAGRYRVPSPRPARRRRA